MQLHAFISGRVQGVFFRDTAQEKAEKFNIKGWVRNLSDGRVEVLAVGSHEFLQNFLDWLYIGPPLAKVTHIEYEWGDLTPFFTDFGVTW